MSNVNVGRLEVGSLCPLCGTLVSGPDPLEHRCPKASVRGAPIDPEVHDLVASLKRSLSGRNMRFVVGELMRELGSESATTKLRSQVHEFHVLLGQPERDLPGTPTGAEVRLRAALVIEEAFEFLEALFTTEYASVRLQELKAEALQVCRIADANAVNFPEAVDALADIDYVVEGSRLVFGVNGAPIADEVHAANMRKFGGGKDERGKFIKPAGWEPPNIVGRLRDQGWKS